MIDFIVFMLIFMCLPRGLQIVIRVILAVTSVIILMFFWRIGVFSALSPVFDDICHSSWELLKNLWILAIYAVTGYCSNGAGCGQPI
jgi:hypothetical protein